MRRNGVRSLAVLSHPPAERRSLGRRQRGLTPQNLPFAAVLVGFAGSDGWDASVVPVGLASTSGLLTRPHTGMRLSVDAKKCYGPGVWRFVGNPDTEKETIMREMFSGSMITVAIAGAAVGVISLSVIGTLAQAPGRFRHGARRRRAENALGRTRSAGHLDR